MAKNIIKLNRGDSYAFKVCIPEEEDSTKHFILTGSDIVYFALLYPHQRVEDAILTKVYDHTDQIIKNDVNTGEILIKIEPKDTKDLETGVYYYTVKLHRGSASDIMDTLKNPSEVRTLIERTKFIIND